MSAAEVGDDGSEKPRLQAVGKVPTVAAMGSRAPKGAATKHTEQAAHQAAIWAALELDLMVGKIGFSYEPIQAFPTRQGCTPESYELVATFISV